MGVKTLVNALGKGINYTYDGVWLYKDR